MDRLPASPPLVADQWLDQAFRNHKRFEEPS
jgi:hypothetical protein